MVIFEYLKRCWEELECGFWCWRDVMNYRGCFPERRSKIFFDFLLSNSIETDLDCFLNDWCPDMEENYN